MRNYVRAPDLEKWWCQAVSAGLLLIVAATLLAAILG